MGAILIAFRLVIFVLLFFAGSRRDFLSHVSGKLLILSGITLWNYEGGALFKR
jgi:hypothetical protein